jgi:hypothetical protein
MFSFYGIDKGKDYIFNKIQVKTENLGSSLCRESTAPDKKHLLYTNLNCKIKLCVIFFENSEFNVNLISLTTH